MEAAISGTQLVVALVLGLAALIFMVLRTKIQAFLALIIAAIIIGITAGLGTDATVSAITAGFGGTLTNIGIIIGFGVMMGQIFEVSGSAEKMARTFLKLFGKGREESAMALTGFIVSIPIFCDSGYVVLSPLARALSRQTRKSIVSIGVPLAAGLVTTHTLVPPTPGPIGVAGIFGVDIGQFIIYGLIISVPIVICTTLYAKWLGKKIYQLPAADGDGWERPPYQEPVYSDADNSGGRVLPSAFASFLPLAVPIVLIFFNTALKAMGRTGYLASFLVFLGTPIIAIAIGLLISIYTLASSLTREQVIVEMEKGIRSAGLIILVTGGGGSLGSVLRTSGIGDFIANYIAQTSLPVILLPFIIATLVRFAQGSGTVAQITSASITAPIVAAAGGNMLLGAFAACVGACFFAYFNDSFFWVVNRMMGIREAKDQIWVWSIPTTIVWGVGMIMVLILNAVM